jgi:hypothetical protein
LQVERRRRNMSADGFRERRHRRSFPRVRVHCTRTPSE